MFPTSNISEQAALGGAQGVAPLRSDRSPARRSWRDTLRNAVDLAVAFATLADVEILDEDSPRPPVETAPVVRHPHRAPLRTPIRAGRPGAVAAQSQPCLSPVDGRHAYGAAPAPKRRARV
jgi:hypothetical protein